MLTVFIPTFYAWSVHGIWIGLLVFVIMAILVPALNFWYMLRRVPLVEVEEGDGASPEKIFDRMFSPLVTYRTILGTVVCIVIAISSMGAGR